MAIASNSIDIRNCVFGFQCTASWDKTSETFVDNVRHCEACDKHVYMVNNTDELSEAIKLNRCVAFSVKNELLQYEVLSGHVERYCPPEK